MPPAGPPRIVVVDDEPDLRRALTEFLMQHGFAAEGADGGPALDAALARGGADLVVLDAAMPGEDGIAIVRRLRAVGSVLILLLTGAGEPVDRIVGLEVGADDCVAKPAEPREVLARIRALLRRGRTVSPPPGPAPGARFGALTLSLTAQCLVEVDGTHHELTAMEFGLLQAFALHPNRVLSRAKLLSLGHAGGEEPLDRSIDVRIARIRRKVELDPARPQVIRTMRGSGYMFVPGTI